MNDIAEFLDDVISCLKQNFICNLGKSRIKDFESEKSVLVEHVKRAKDMNAILLNLYIDKDAERISSLSIVDIEPFNKEFNDYCKIYTAFFNGVIGQDRKLLFDKLYPYCYNYKGKLSPSQFIKFCDSVIEHESLSFVGRGCYKVDDISPDEFNLRKSVADKTYLFYSKKLLRGESQLFNNSIPDLEKNFCRTNFTPDIIYLLHDKTPRIDACDIPELTIKISEEFKELFNTYYHSQLHFKSSEKRLLYASIYLSLLENGFERSGSTYKTSFEFVNEQMH